jgi:hypothetical protein
MRRRQRDSLSRPVLCWVRCSGPLDWRGSIMRLGSGRRRSRVDRPGSTPMSSPPFLAQPRESCRPLGADGPAFRAHASAHGFRASNPAQGMQASDFDRHRIIVAEQFSAATRRLRHAKNHLRREAPLTAHARDALQTLPREGEFCFVSLRGEHWTPSSRASTGRPSELPQARREASISPPATSPAGTWSTSLKWPQRT